MRKGLLIASVIYIIGAFLWSMFMTVGKGIAFASYCIVSALLLIYVFWDLFLRKYSGWKILSMVLLSASFASAVGFSIALSFLLPRFACDLMEFPTLHAVGAGAGWLGLWFSYKFYDSV